jgi:redox-sensitive bicupin YhaK (pirin superfamily)
MILLRRAGERGHANHGWLDSHHTFSFADYHDPQWMGYGPLRVVNEDRVAAGGGFAPHRHANMEIISYVIEGALQHRDSIGNGSVMRPGDVQCMSAGSGIEHSEFNASQDAPVHFLQVWIQPNRINAKPGYAQQHFPIASRRGVLRLVASPDGADGSLAILQDARVYASVLAPGETVAHELGVGRRAWVQVVRGALRLDDETVLVAGDAAGIDARNVLHLRAESDSEMLLFDLP